MKLLSGAMVYCDVKEIPQTPAPVDIDPLSFLQSRAFVGILKFNLKFGQQAYPPPPVFAKECVIHRK